MSPRSCARPPTSSTRCSSSYARASSCRSSACWHRSSDRIARSTLGAPERRIPCDSRTYDFRAPVARPLRSWGMRTLLSLAAIFTSFHTNSDACGWTPPRLVLHHVTSHAVLLADSAWRQRAFVVLGDAPKIDDAQWQALAPLTYDNTRIAELSSL